jgi:hypothetical protein
MSVTLEPYQLQAIDSALPILEQSKIVYIRAWMRKGKTFISLSVANKYLKHTPNAHVLFVTPINAQSSVQKDYDTLAPRFALTIINNESLHKIDRKYNLVIVDEAHKISKYPKPAKAAMQLKQIAAFTPIIYLSATPSAESYSQLYHQLWISTYTPLKQWDTFYRFANEFVNKQVQEYKGLPSTNYDDCDVKKLAPYIKHLFVTIREDEGKEMVKVKHNILYVDMTPKAIEIFFALKRHKIYIDQDGNAATCNSGAERDNKLLQISSGTLKFNENVNGAISGIGKIIDTTKAEYIRDYFKGQKIAILYLYAAEGEMLKQFFPNYTESSDEFNASPDKVYIKQIVSAKVGVDLSTADAMIVMTPSDSAETFIQASARIQHVKRTKDANVYWIMSKHGLEAKKLKNASTNKNEYTAYHYEKTA